MKKLKLKTHSASFLLSLTALLFFSMSSSAWAGVEEATEFYANKQYPQALAQLRDPKVASTPKAQQLLGTMYLLGQGVEKNVPKSVELFEAAADKNQPEAQLNLGTMYMVGQNVKRDNVVAFKWFTVLLAQKDSDAGFMLSFLAPSMSKAQKAEGFELASNYLTAKNIAFNDVALARMVGVKK